MNCPKCLAELAVLDVDGLELDSCPSCQGVWFDNDELRQGKDLSDENLVWMDFELWKHTDRFELQPGVECPKCAVTMGSMLYGDTGVTVEHCSKCRGVWLDEGELEHIVRSLQDELAKRSASELLSDSLKEGMEIVTGPENLASEWRDFKQVMKLLYLRLTIENPGVQALVESSVRNNPMG